MASCPTTVCWPLEYSAKICPPLATATWTSCAAGDPSWVTAAVDEGCAYWVSRGGEPLYRFQFTFMSEAPSARPVICSCGEGSVAAGVVSFPFESNVMLPANGVAGGLF